MAKILEEFPVNPVGRQAKYPWKVWLDGKPRLLVQGEDFETTPANFRATAFQAAARSGIKIRTAAVGQNDIAVQAFDL